ncbi:CopG family transcriptional regulator [Lacinutrix sp.]|uniref:CopG family transcriptional regulator n=1 Tax=Lacinutrix sp. TaxID=1937692 RepID=UPI0025BA39DD|nr:CopG family transcriptional regulator [Lacinutrix sp.]
MATFTSSLPSTLLERLASLAKELELPKNKLLQNALELYLEQLEKASYIKSYKEAGKDDDLMLVAEEGLLDYFNTINEIES